MFSLLLSIVADTITTHVDAPTFPSHYTRKVHTLASRYDWLRRSSLFRRFPSSMLGFENIPQRIHDLFDEWGQPIPIAIEFLEDELDLKARIIRVTMEPKAIDFDENDDGFDYVIDIEFVREVSYRRRRLYGVPPNYFVV